MKLDFSLVSLEFEARVMSNTGSAKVCYARIVMYENSESWKILPFIQCHNDLNSQGEPTQRQI